MNEFFEFDSAFLLVLIWGSWIGTGIVVAAAFGLEIARSNDAKREDKESLPDSN